jgi:FkbM family methyltransferase
MRKWVINALKKIFYAIKLKIAAKDDSGFSELFGKNFYYHNKKAFEVTFREIFKKGIYTFNSDNELPVIIDCGANMGLSLLFFSKNYPNTKIYAFEPDKNVLPYLERNIATFKMDKVELIKKAVWNSVTTLDFYTDNGMGGRAEKKYENQAPYKVETIRLKDFISDKHVGLLKMDIEGAEFMVVQDCEPVLKQIDNIFIEYHSMIDEEQKLDDLLLILKRNGFRYHLSQSFSRNKPFVDINLSCEKTDMAINVYGYK